MQKLKMSSQKIKKRIGEIGNAVMVNGDRVVATNYGLPVWAIIPISDLRRLEELDAKENDDVAQR